MILIITTLCHYAKCHALLTVVPINIMRNVVITQCHYAVSCNIIMLTVVILSVVGMLPEHGNNDTFLTTRANTANTRGGFVKHLSRT
jgi:hypothetical protein